MMDKKIKLFVDAHSFDTELQGTQTFIRELYKALFTEHPEMDIYFGAYHPERVQNAFPFIDTSKILKYKRSGISRFIFDIPFFLKKYKFDFAHFQYICPQKIRGCKYIVTLHDTLYNDFSDELSFLYTKSRDLLFGRSIRMADIKTTVSGYSRQTISKYYKIPVEKIHVIPNGVSHSFNPYAPEAAVKMIKQKFGMENFILLVSRIEPRKNHLLLLKKYLQLELYKKKISLVFIGKSSIKVPSLQLAIDSLNREQKSFFYSFDQVSQDDLAAFYTACRLFVYPSKGEGFGIPPLEAAICNAPVLCSSATAMSDFTFFQPYTFDPNNEKQFEEKLLQMLAQPPGESFLNNVAEQIAKNYSWRTSADIFYNLLQANKA